MKEYPIIFSTEMVRAILDGRKTQTRRIVKANIPDDAYDVFAWYAPEIPDKNKAEEGLYYWYGRGLKFEMECPYGKIGDRLWVRESFAYMDLFDVGYERDEPYLIGYRADKTCKDLLNNVWSETTDWNWEHDTIKWKPSIHMKREESRIILEITNIKVERLQDITEEDCQAEGVKWQWNGNCEDCYQWSFTGNKKSNLWFDYAESCFQYLWDSIHKKENRWRDNPWVWAIEFKRI